MKRDFATVCEAIDDAELLAACAAAVRGAVSKADLDLTPAELRGVVAKGATYLVDHGAYLVGDMLFLPAAH